MVGTTVEIAEVECVHSEIAEVRKIRGTGWSDNEDITAWHRPTRQRCGEGAGSGGRLAVLVRCHKGIR